MEDSFQGIKGSYERWMLNGALSDGKTTSPAEFREFLTHIEERIPSIPCRVMPSSFDPADPELRAVPWTLMPSWPSLERALCRLRSEALVLRLPLFWQIEQPLHAACRAAGAYLFVNEPENMPLGAAALRLAEADTVLTTPRDAAAFSSYLAEHSIPLARAWVLVHPLQSITDLPPALCIRGIDVAQEVHLFPGVPIFEQCEHLQNAKQPVFHANEDFAVEDSGGRLLLTSATEKHPLPLYRYEAPGRFDARTCSCGKPAFAAIF